MANHYSSNLIKSTVRTPKCHGKMKFINNLGSSFPAAKAVTLWLMLSIEISWLFCVASIRPAAAALDNLW